MTFEFDTAYGVLGNNSADDTVKLQLAINTATAAGHGLYITGRSLVSIQNASTGQVLDIPSNAHIKFLNGASLKLIGPYTNNSYDMMRVVSRSNVQIDYPVLDGSKELQTLAPSGNDYGMGISIYGSSNVTINNPVIRDTWGDGIYVSAAAGAPTVAPSTILINNPHIIAVRRNGISVISANGLIVNNPVFDTIQDTNPMSGMDFEPNANTDVLKAIQVNNFIARNCQGGIGFAFENLPGAIAQVVDITISGATLNCQDTGLSFYNLAKGAHSVSGHITINSPVYQHCWAPTEFGGWDNSITPTINNPVTIL